MSLSESRGAADGENTTPDPSALFDPRSQPAAALWHYDMKPGESTSEAIANALEGVRCWICAGCRRRFWFEVDRCADCGGQGLDKVTIGGCPDQQTTLDEVTR